MDTAVALVQAYLNVNGYFTVVEYPVLGCPIEQPDMIVGEVKEGVARFNPATRDPAVLAVALARFGCCSGEHAHDLTRRLLARGRVDTPAGHALRMIAFGTVSESSPSGRWTTIPMPHGVAFLRQYLHEHWKVLRHAQIKDSTLGVLALLEKWGGPPGRPSGHAHRRGSRS